MRISFAFAAALAAAIATVVESAPLEPRDPPYDVVWYGYKQTRFQGAAITSHGSQGVCHRITNYDLIHNLYSAKVDSGGGTSPNARIYLYTGTACSGSSQVIDTAGYRDMTNLPAYNSWIGYHGS